jgi:hypothetical protein
MKKATKIKPKEPEQPSYPCPSCGKEWSVLVKNTGFCECGNEFKTFGWPEFRIEWYTIAPESIGSQRINNIHQGSTNHTNDTN